MSNHAEHLSAQICFKKDKDLVCYYQKCKHTYLNSQPGTLRHIYTMVWEKKNTRMKTDKTEHNLSICAPSVTGLQRVTRARPKWKQKWYRLENITLAVLHDDRTQLSEAVCPSERLCHRIMVQYSVRLNLTDA